MNKQIIDQYTKLVKHIKYNIKTPQDRFRLSQTIKILDILKKYPKPITSGAQLSTLPNVGMGTVKRIDEILKTGFLSEITPKDYKAYEELEQIFGIGKEKAKDLIENHNIKSIKQLKQAIKSKTITVPRDIILGLKYNNAIKQSIPRDEIDEFGKLLKARSIKATICGSYRRGKQSSNDIDILITGKSNNLRKIVETLRDIIVDDIDEGYNVKYMGFVKFMGKVRRLDIMYVPLESYYTALLHFTGSWGFNQKLRMVAIELGYTLNQYGLFKNGIAEKVASEKDVFDKLGMEYIEPKDR